MDIYYWWGNNILIYNIYCKSTNVPSKQNKIGNRKQ
jgi:hypothetical protein